MTTLPPPKFHAGLRLLTLPGPPRMLAGLFYPTVSEPRSFVFGREPFAPHVAYNGALPERVRGLVLLSHGTGANVMALHPLAQALASHGYLAAALQHPGDTWDDRSLAATPAYFAERPRHVSRLLDTLLEHPDWRDLIPRDCIGAAGHSAGGYTVLALAGGVADPARIGAHCAAHGGDGDDGIFCSLGFASSPAQDMTFDVRDDRIRAVAALAPLGVVFDPASLARITVPLHIITAEHDIVLRGRHHGERLAAGIPHAAYREVAGAGHFAFMAQPTRSLPSMAGDPGDNPPGFDRAALHTSLHGELAAFFDRHLPQEGQNV